MELQSNIRLTRIKLKYVAFNWFRRRILHAFNLAIRFGACKMRRLNRALMFIVYWYYIIFHSLLIFVSLLTWFLHGLDALQLKAVGIDFFPWSKRLSTCVRCRYKLDSWSAPFSPFVQRPRQGNCWFASEKQPPYPPSILLIPCHTSKSYNYVN